MNDAYKMIYISTTVTAKLWFRYFCNYKLGAHEGYQHSLSQRSGHRLTRT